MKIAPPIRCIPRVDRSIAIFDFDTRLGVGDAPQTSSRECDPNDSSDRPVEVRSRNNGKNYLLVSGLAQRPILKEATRLGEAPSGLAAESQFEIERVRST